MTDRELLEAAAKAACIALIPYIWNKGTGWDYEGFTISGEGQDEWNPLEDDGDALRLAVKLSLAVTPYPIYEHPKHSVIVARKSLEDSRTEVGELYGSDPMAATRRAIVRAAAAMAQEGKL